MAITVGGRVYRTLEDDLFVNGDKVYEVTVNGEKVYPEKKIKGAGSGLFTTVFKHHYRYAGKVVLESIYSTYDRSSELPFDGILDVEMTIRVMSGRPLSSAVICEGGTIKPRTQYLMEFFDPSKNYESSGGEYRIIDADIDYLNPSNYEKYKNLLNNVEAKKTYCSGEYHAYYEITPHVVFPEQKIDGSLLHFHDGNIYGMLSPRKESYERYIRTASTTYYVGYDGQRDVIKYAPNQTHHIAHTYSGNIYGYKNYEINPGYADVCTFEKQRKESLTCTIDANSYHSLSYIRFGDIEYVDEDNKRVVYARPVFGDENAFFADDFGNYYGNYPLADYDIAYTDSVEVLPRSTLESVNEDGSKYWRGFNDPRGVTLRLSRPYVNDSLLTSRDYE